MQTPSHNRTTARGSVTLTPHRSACRKHPRLPRHYTTPGSRLESTGTSSPRRAVVGDRRRLRSRDGVWGGSARRRRPSQVFLDAHLDRLFRGREERSLDIGLARAPAQALYDTLAANAHDGDGVHDPPDGHAWRQAHALPGPRVTSAPATVVIIAEVEGRQARDACRRAHPLHRPCAPRLPDVRTPKLNSLQQAQLHHRLHPATAAGCRRGPLMLDHRGFVATCNSTHFFIVRRGGSGRRPATTASAASPAPTCSRCCRGGHRRARENFQP